MYCSRCVTKNDDDSAFCKKCGNDLNAPSAGPAPQRAEERDHGDDCERDCQGDDKNMSMFWGIIVIIIGAWVIWEWGLKNFLDVPDEIANFEWCWLIWVVVGIFILMAGFRMIARHRGRR